MSAPSPDDRQAGTPAQSPPAGPLADTPELARLAVLFRRTLRNAELNPLLYLVQRYRRPERS